MDLVAEEKEARERRRQKLLEYYDNGTLNDIIEGYIKIAFDELRLTERLDGFSFTNLFDEYTVTDAWRRANEDRFG